MWKKNEPQSHSPEPAPEVPVQRPEPPPKEEVATIGPTITIKGEISGKENLEIQGKLEGIITMKGHRVTVGQKGRVKADIHAKAIHIAGEVDGNLFGEGEVVLRESGRLLGNITAARVTLEDGSQFKGSIDMEPAKRDSKPSRATSAIGSGNGEPRDRVQETAIPLVG
jgi:cytoskeletal protein CcmA (bactofilin family)